MPTLDLGTACRDMHAHCHPVSTLAPNVFTLAHLSDPHIGPLPRPRLSDLAGKRVTGYWNWHRHRRALHSMAAFSAIMADMLKQHPDHVALTGDLANVGLPAEFPAAARRIEVLGPPECVSIVPGNHDAYVRGALAAMTASLGAYMMGDDVRPSAPRYPYLRRRDGIALIGLSSAVPTAPFMASGRVGREQRDALAALLETTRREGLARVIMIHHPPHPGGAGFGRGLRDASALSEVIRAQGAELVIHGHNHRASLAWLHGARDARIPIVGVPSASAIPGTPAHHAAYHLFRIQTFKHGLAITVEKRGFAPQTENVQHLSTVALVAPAA